MDDLDRLTAIQEIKLLKARRDRAADTHDWDLYESLHAPDHRSIGQDYGEWTTAAQMVANVRKAMRGLLTLHHSHTPLIAFDTPDAARGIWAMKGLSMWRQAGEPHWFLAFGHYHERYGRRDGAWKFTRRELVYYHTERSPGAVFPPRIDPSDADEAIAVASPAAIPPLPADLSPLDRLVAVQAIEALRARYDQALDRRDWDTCRALHASDPVSHDPDPWRTAQAIVAAARGSLDAGTTTVHHSHTGEITFATPTRATGIWPMEAQVFRDDGTEPRWLHRFGFHHETYEKRDGEWRFTSRRFDQTAERMVSTASSGE